MNIVSFLLSFFNLRTNHSFPSLPSLCFFPHLLSSPFIHNSARVRPPIGVNKALHTKLREHQVPPLYIKAVQDILPQEIGFKELAHVPGTDLGLTARGHKHTKVYNYHIHAEGLGQFYAGCLVSELPRFQVCCLWGVPHHDPERII